MHWQQKVSSILWSAISTQKGTFQSLCGVPYTALPIATLISVQENIPMLIRRKEVKDYGTKKAIEGELVAGSNCLVVEDVVTTGGSVLETCDALNKVKLVVTQCVVLLDREQGGRDNLEKSGVTLTSVLTLSQLLHHLYEANKITKETVVMVKTFIQENSSVPSSISVNPAVISFSERASSASHPLTKQLLTLMDRKQSNLALSADVATSDELIKLVDTVGPYVCMVKTHVDMIVDFSISTTVELKRLASKHDFVIMEDRKFADIGNTVKNQYTRYLSSGWADLVTCHALPGPGLLDGLKEVAPSGSGCVLVAEMSTAGTLAMGEYSKSTVKMAESRLDFAVGIISRSQLSLHPHIIHMTPGVGISVTNDSLGQQYLSPEEAVLERKADIVIVGRGITKSEDHLISAQLYRDRAFDAYKKRVSHDS